MELVDHVVVKADHERSRLGQPAQLLILPFRHKAFGDHLQRAQARLGRILTCPTLVDLLRRLDVGHTQIADDVADAVARRANR